MYYIFCCNRRVRYSLGTRGMFFLPSSLRLQMCTFPFHCISQKLGGPFMSFHHTFSSSGLVSRGPDVVSVLSLLTSFTPTDPYSVQ